MRVLAVTQTYPKHAGDSTSPFMDLIVRALARRGHTVDVVLPYHPEFRYASDEHVQFFPCRYSPVRRWAPWGLGNALRANGTVRLGVAASLPAVAVTLRRRVAQLLDARKYDVVHAHWVIPNAWLAATPSLAHGVPLVVSVHGSDVSLAERHPLLARAARRGFDVAAAVSAPSDHLRARAEAVGADPTRTVTVRWGVDTVAFSPRTAEAVLRKRLLGAGGDDDMLFVAVGRLVECKGFEYLIDAAARVDGIRVAIVGDGDLRADLEGRAGALRAPVTFTGALPQRDVANALAAADAVVVPLVVDRSGRVDGFAMTVLEGLASGRPLIASRIAGVPELVVDGVNGLLVGEKDTAGLAAAIAHLRQSPDERGRLGANGRTTAEALTWDASARGMEALYERATTG
jgi:glycosyltransferase involved in cell wall biosynthesis